MIKLFTFLFIVLSICFGLEPSLRMKALGTDFVRLIPDYETDLFYDANLYDKKLLGISYEPGSSAPVTFRILPGRFGLCGQYWGSHIENKPSYVNTTSFYVNDLWLLDLRGKFWKFLTKDVWNLSNDGSYCQTKYDYGDTLRTIKYLMRANGVERISTNFQVTVSGCSGVLNNSITTYGYPNRETINQWLLIGSGNIGILYQNITANNRFTSFYLDFGGPASTKEIDGLPYSVFSHLDDEDIRLCYFLRTLIANFGWAKGIPIGNGSFVAIGLHNAFLYQRTNEADTIELRGLRNTLSFPVAMEYTINKVILRMGTKVFYTLNNYRNWDSDSIYRRINEHRVKFDYSFGLGFQPNDHLNLDFCNDTDISSVNYWSIYLKYIY